MNFRLSLLVFALLAVMPVSAPAAQDALKSEQVAEDAPLVFELNQMPSWPEIPHGKTVYVFEMNESVLCRDNNIEFLREYRSSETWRYSILYWVADKSKLCNAMVVIEEKQPGQAEWKKIEKWVAGGSILLPGQEKAIPIDVLAERAIDATRLPYISAFAKLGLGRMLAVLVAKGKCKPHKGNMGDGELIIENIGESEKENYSLRRIDKGGKEVYIAVLDKKKKKAWVVPAASVPEVKELLNDIFNPSGDDGEE